MVHDTKRVESLRTRAKAQLELVSTLQAKIAEGELPQLTLARNLLEDMESFFLARLDTEERTPLEEARWLAGPNTCFKSGRLNYKESMPGQKLRTASNGDYRRVVIRAWVANWCPVRLLLHSLQPHCFAILRLSRGAAYPG
jgi:hypothetical protein